MTHHNVAYILKLLEGKMHLLLHYCCNISELYSNWLVSHFSVFYFQVSMNEHGVFSRTRWLWMSSETALGGLLSKN